MEMEHPAPCHQINTLFWTWFGILSVSIQDPNSIVLSMDMHLAIPPGFVNYARKVRISMQVCINGLCTLCVSGF